VRMRSRGWLPRTQCDYARFLLDRGDADDRERARALLDEALATSQELGLKGWLDQCLAVRLRAQGIDSSTITRSIHVIATSIGARRPDLARHAAPDGTVTLLFSDMEGFTRMTERLGDVEAHKIVQHHNEIVREQTSAFGGHEVELRGDGFLLAFGSARKGLDCAVALQRAMVAYSREHPEQPIRLRIGLHTGEAIKDAEKFFGKTVIQAFRIADLAAGGEILVSSLLKQLVESAGDLAFDAGRSVELKGISGTHRLYAMDWA